MKSILFIVLSALVVSSGMCAQPMAEAIERALPVVAAGDSASAAQANTRDNPWGLPDDPLLGFIEIPAGEFLMGDNEDNQVDPHEPPQHPVSVSAFFIGRHEVTVSQFAIFVKDAGDKPDPRSLEGPMDHPVPWVSWHDAVAYCDWLTGRLRDWTGTPSELASRLRGVNGARRWKVNLPSEAARGTDGRRYPWGNQLADSTRANYDDNPKGTVAVGTYPAWASPYGVLDMAGNVLEWTRSLKGAWRTLELRAAGAAPTEFGYPSRADDGRENLDAAPTHNIQPAIRGGSFRGGDRLIRASFRGWGDPRFRGGNIGFRVAVSPFSP